MRRHHLLLSAAAAAALATPAAAEADAPWSAAQSTGAVIPTHLAADAQGELSLFGIGPGQAPAALRTRAPGGAFGAPRALGFSPTAVAPLSSAVIAVGERAVGKLTGPTQVRESGGGSARTLATARHLVGAPEVATGPGGRTAVAWGERTGDVTRLRVRLRGATGDFGAPITVSGAADTGSPALAYGADGSLAVAFERVVGSRRLVEARTSTDGRTFGPLRAVGRDDGAVSTAVAVGAAGRLVVLYATSDGGEEVNTTTRYVLGTASRGGRFRTRGVDPGGTRTSPVSAPQLAADGSGRIVALWQSVGTGAAHTPIEALAVEADGRIDATQVLAPAGQAPDLAVAPDGTAVATWGVGAIETPASGIAAAVQPGGGATFGATEVVSAAADSSPVVAVDPTTDRATIAFLGRPGRQPGQPLTSVPAVTQVTDRP